MHMWGFIGGIHCQSRLVWGSKTAIIVDSIEQYHNSLNAVRT